MDRGLVRLNTKRLSLDIFYSNKQKTHLMKKMIYTLSFLATMSMFSCESEDSYDTEVIITQDPTITEALLADTSNILQDSTIAYLWGEGNLNYLQSHSSTYFFSSTRGAVPERKESADAPAMEKKVLVPSYKVPPSLPPPPPPPAAAQIEVEELEEYIVVSDVNEEPVPYVEKEVYDVVRENVFIAPPQMPISTFSIDVDNASYSSTRMALAYHRLPAPTTVRIEEMINYFDYKYPQPRGKKPFSINTEIGPAPWNPEHRLVHIGLQGKKLDYKNLKASNLVFLIDVSGSMDDQNKLPLLKKSFKVLLDELSKKDKVSIVVYAGAAGMVLEPTPASDKEKIIAALDNLSAGGSTAGGAGINLAYKLAKENLIEGGNNRVILATDGDFNVGTYETGSLVDLIEEKRKDDIYLTICGFGMGNYKDGRMEEISNAGNGNYFYIDTEKEAEKVFEKEMRANMFTIAKDVKIQVEFNPNLVKAYRLIGYENRMMAAKDFDDDTKDAGELGAGHTVTAIYEVILADSKSSQEIYNNKKSKAKKGSLENNTSDLMAIKFRYKPPSSDKSILIEHKLKSKKVQSIENTSNNFRFSAAVAGFGMLLKDSDFKSEVDYDLVARFAKSALGKDKNGYRKEFLSLVKSAKQIAIDNQKKKEDLQ